MEMILGIIIGLVIWQIVIFILQHLQMEETLWCCPIPYLCLRLIDFITSCWICLVNIKVLFYCIRLGKNPFAMRIKELKELPLEQREKIVALAHKKYKNKLEFLLTK